MSLQNVSRRTVEVFELPPSFVKIHIFLARSNLYDFILTNKAGNNPFIFVQKASILIKINYNLPQNR